MIDIDRIARRELRRKSDREAAIRAGHGRPSMLGINHLAGFGAANLSDVAWSDVVLAMHMDSPLEDLKGATVSAFNGAAVSAAQSMFGGYSLLLDGSNDYLTVPSSSSYNFSTGDYTVEFFTRLASTSGTIGAVTRCNAAETQGWEVGMTGAQLWLMWSAGSYSYVSGTGGSFPLNTWIHAAVCRASGTTRGFVGGNEVFSTASYSGSADYAYDLSIGSTASGALQFLNGYVDDLRICRYALYTSSFTPPVAAFADS